jgi:hypothetical protein
MSDAEEDQFITTEPDRDDWQARMASPDDPDWLLGETTSYCQVPRYTYEERRQFVVLPFYEDGIQTPGTELFMLWGRALSDNWLYPIPHDWYVMFLVPDSRDGPNRRDFQWVCRTREMVN